MAKRTQYRLHDYFPRKKARSSGMSNWKAKLYGLAAAAQIGYKAGKVLRTYTSANRRSPADYASHIVKAGRASVRYGSTPASGAGGNRYRTRGSYYGRFKRSKRLNKKQDAVLHRGFLNTTEITGTVADPNCVYVGHSCMSGNEVIEGICSSLLRQLYKKALDLNVTNIQEPLPAFGVGGYTLRIERELMDGTNTIQQFDYVPSATDTIQFIVGSRVAGIVPAWATLLDVFKDYASGNSASTVNLYQPTKLYFLETLNFNVLARINLKNERVHVRVDSHIKVQNRTLAADASSDATDVSNNPLVGKLYSFSSGCPMTKVDYAPLVNSIPDFTGAITIPSASFTKTGFFEPPHPKIFVNCKKSTGVRLEPGQIKEDRIKFSSSTPLLKFLTTFGYGIGPTGAVATLNRQMKLKGTCTLIALEDVINVNALQNISVAYEINRRTAVYTTPMKPATSLGALYQATQSA